MRSSRLGTFAFVVVVAVVSLVVIVPILWALSTSFKLPNQILTASATLFPTALTLQNYQQLVADRVDIGLVNSTMVSAGTIALALMIGSCAGYALSRYGFRGRRAILLLLVATMAVPVVNLLVPLQLMLGAVGLLGNLAILTLLYTALTTPLAVWTMRAHFDSVPIELEQAAWVDGYSRFATIRKIVLIGTRPALLVVALVAFLTAWNDFILASTMTSAPSDRTTQVALIFYQGVYGVQWGPLMGGVTLATLPPVVAFLVLRRNLIRGVASGAIKG